MRTGVVALLAASTLLPLAPTAQAGPRYRSRAYSPGYSHHHHHGYGDGWAVAGGFFVGTLFGAFLASPPPRRVIVQPAPVYVAPPPPDPAPGVVYPTSPAPLVTTPGAAQVWIPAHTVWRETPVVDPALYQTRRVPIVSEVEVPVFEDRSVPVTQEVVEPVYESRRDPVTGVTSTVKVGENRRTVVVGTRIERVQVGTRTERRTTGWRDVQVLVRPETTRMVRVAEYVPGRWTTVSEGAPAAPDAGATTVPPTTDETQPAPMPPAPPPPTPPAATGPSPATPTPPAEPLPEPTLPEPINPR